MTFNSEPNIDNIYFCSEIRDTFIKYYELVIKVFEKKAKFTIKNEAINYFERDELAFILNQMIKEFILDKNLTNIGKVPKRVRARPCPRTTRGKNEGRYLEVNF